jgi:hypothetical protein
VKQPATETEVAACGTEKQAHGGCVDQIIPIRAVALASIVNSEADCVDANDNIGEIRPGVGSSSKEILGVDDFCVIRTSQFGAGDPVAPDVFTAIKFCDAY